MPVCNVVAIEEHHGIHRLERTAYQAVTSATIESVTVRSDPASRIFTSWNQVDRWLRQLDHFRAA
jgi:hypothetical protein